MKNQEKNQLPINIKVHDIVFIGQNQRTDEDGTLRGYSWGSKGDMGLVTEVSETYIVYKLPNGEYDKYDANVIDKDYFYTIGLASEVEYQTKIKENLERLFKEREEKDNQIKKAQEFLEVYTNEISLLGKLLRFLKLNSIK